MVGSSTAPDDGRRRAFEAARLRIARMQVAGGASLGDAGWHGLPYLLGSSAALYMAGMAFNDIADRDEDAEVRPNRPIPSGQVSFAGAIACAFALDHGT